MTGWSLPEGSGQRFNVWMDTSNKWHPSEGLIMSNNFINDINSGTECAISKSEDDTKLSGTAYMPDGWEAIQRDLHRLKWWAHVNVVRFSVAKCRVLHLGCSNPRYQYILGYALLFTLLKLQMQVKKMQFYVD